MTSAPRGGGDGRQDILKASSFVAEVAGPHHSPPSWVEAFREWIVVSGSTAATSAYGEALHCASERLPVAPTPGNTQRAGAAEWPAAVPDSCRMRTAAQGHLPSIASMSNGARSAYGKLFARSGRLCRGPIPVRGRPTERTEERVVAVWQVGGWSGRSAAGTTSAARSHSRLIVAVSELANGTEVEAIWAWLPESHREMLVTVYFPDSLCAE